jgi:ribosome-associated protein
MPSEYLKGRDFSKEFVFKTSRSGGPGGQNVNKVSTKVELRIDLNSSRLFTEEEKNILAVKLRTRINSDGELIIVSQTERSQLKNKEDAISKFYSIIEKALTPKKKRRPSRPTLASKTRRLKKKLIRSDQKSLRKDFDFE